MLMMMIDDVSERGLSEGFEIWLLIQCLNVRLTFSIYDRSIRVIKKKLFSS